MVASPHERGEQGESHGESAEAGMPAAAIDMVAYGVAVAVAVVVVVWVWVAVAVVVVVTVTVTVTLVVATTVNLEQKARCQVSFGA